MAKPVSVSVKVALLCAAATLAAAPAPVARRSASAAGAPHRIVSINLCADQLVLHLADRGQIAGLSRNAADPSFSPMAARARGLNILRSSAETLLVARPDMVVTIPAQPFDPLGVLKAGSYRLVEAPDAASYPEIVARVRQVGAAVGHPERAAALISRMDRRLAALPRNPGQGRVAAYYQRRGYLTGRGTLVDDLMQRVGLVNLAGKLGKPVLSQLSLEELVAARPDYLIMDIGNAEVTDQGTEMLQHPALRGIPRLWLRDAWTTCGSPEYVLAAESLTRQLRATAARR